MSVVSIPKETIHEDLRRRYGAEVTRKELFAYRDEAGVYPVWIRTDPNLKVVSPISGTPVRGVYKTPPAGYAGTTVATVVKENAERAKHYYVFAANVISEQADASPTVSTPSLTDTTSADDETPESMPDVIDPSLLKSLAPHDRLKLIAQQASLLARVPKRDPAFVPFGDAAFIGQVIKSRRYYSTFIQGLSGCGKTFTVEQMCALEKREYIRVNITQETDEDDLIGGFRLVDGNTVFEVGPVIVAMIRGAILLIDEIDYASPKIACIQSVLEHTPGRMPAVTLKKLGITVTAAPGFAVFATANTKGRGDETGQFFGVNILNEAFLERFAATIEQQYPDEKTETKILTKTFKAMGFAMTDHARVYFTSLAKWAAGIRKTYVENAIDSVISTRRLVHIINTYGVLGADDAAGEHALSYCLSRFDAKTQDALSDYWSKVAPDPGAISNVGSLDGEEMSDINF